MSSSKVPKAIFVYGTLRADWGPRGDRWGVLDDKESAVVYEYGHITGYVLKQNPRLEYPFIHADSASDSTKKVFGTLLSWPSGGADADTQSTVFQNKLAHCDSIEGYNPEEPSCGKFYVAFKEGEGGGRRRVPIVLCVFYMVLYLFHGVLYLLYAGIYVFCIVASAATLVLYTYCRRVDAHRRWRCGACFAFFHDSA